MKNLKFVFACICLFIFSSCSNNPTSKAGLLERPFNGSADFTSAIYDSYDLGCRTADSAELIAWVKGKNNLPERTYALRSSSTNKVVFADRAGTIRVETIEESRQWLINSGKISFLVVKNPIIIKDFHAEKDPAPNFPRE